VTAGLLHPLAAPFRLEGTSGEAVVLIHGFTGTPAHFRLLAPVLNEAGYTVEVPLLAGHGTSLADMADSGAADWLASARAAVAGVADHRRVHLAGMSLGGLISIVLARPSVAATITTINAPVRLRAKTAHLQARVAPLVAGRRPYTMWPDEAPPPLDEEARPLWLTYPGFPTARAADLFAVSRMAVRAARRLRRPALVIQSKADETVDPRSAVMLSKALGPPARVEWLERSFHNSTLGPERGRIHRLVLEHLRSVAG
jgi:carboxylesterase